MTSYLNEQIALFQIDVEGRNEVFDQLTAEFTARNIVTDAFREKLEERENVFPTGLNINGFGVAIPHTNSEYVKKSQIGFMSLKKAVVFKEMGSADQEVEVQLVFMLALKEAHEQLAMLQNLVAMFQRPGVLESLKEVTGKSELLRILAENGLE
ncbi:MAG: PTS sugar transporter subunit IIA [Streptococcaceae bacterium]|jgi:PTS system galactitol-specific IIA component|nr:PTS sugar transporter subunit IIA [Streptococcaceae bacterium]